MAKTKVKAKSKLSKVKLKPAVKPKAKAKKTIKSVTTGIPPLVKTVIFGIEEKKGENIVCLDLRKINNRVCDFFIVCDANSGTQVSAIAYSVKEEMKKKLSELPYHAEGFQNSEWILLDYITVVVHVFQKETRYFYNIEGLWADAETIRTKY